MKLKRFNKASFTDVDGDKVTISVNRGGLDYNNFALVPEGLGARLVSVTLTDAEFNRATVSIKASHSRTGDGFVDVGSVNARSINLGYLEC